LGLTVLVCLGALVDSGLSSLPENGWTLLMFAIVLLVLALATVIGLVRHNRRQAGQDIEERGWQRKGSIPMRQAPIVEQAEFVSAGQAKVELSCGRFTLGVLSMDGLDQCWSAAGEPGFTRESVDAEAAYRRSATRGRLLVRTVGRALANGI
jgi:hypothetical protein